MGPVVELALGLAGAAICLVAAAIVIRGAGQDRRWWLSPPVRVVLALAAVLSAGALVWAAVLHYGFRNYVF